MLVQLTHHVVNCPICGRPVELQSEYVGRDLVCGHCRGQFVVYYHRDELTATRINGVDSLKRAEQLLERRGGPATDQPDGRSHQPPPSGAVGEDECDVSNPDTQTMAEEQSETKRAVALLVEHRDDVFARVAGDMAKSGMRVIRAESAHDALRMCGMYNPVLVVANVNLPDQTGWLLAGKLWFIDRRIRVWLYQPNRSRYDAGLAHYVQVDELLNYGGDLTRLSEMILERLTARVSRRALNAA